LKGLKGKGKDKEIKFDGISDIEVANAGIYKAGDKVLVQKSTNVAGKEIYYVTDFVRRGYLYLLGAIFCLIIVLIGRQKGIKSLIGLIVSFFIIIKFILPKILDGSNPLYIGLIGAFLILTIIIYLTEGLNKKITLSGIERFHFFVHYIDIFLVVYKVNQAIGLVPRRCRFFTRYD